MFFDLMIFVAVVALVVYLLSLLPIPAPFGQIILVIGIVAVVVALFQAFLGIDVLGHMGTRWK